VFNKLKNEDVFNVFINMFGTVVSQIIPIAFMPILTRLYNPTDFGVFSVYVALAAIGAVIAAGRYEMAILLPKNSIEAFNLLGLSVLISSLMALIFLIIAIFFHRVITSLIGNPLIENWLFLIPVSILFNGIVQASIYWNIRYKRFSTISTAKVLQGLSGTGLQLLLSIQKTVQLGLILGCVLGLITSASMLVKSICTNSKQLLHCLSL
jgi:O-antigen/teichoic acid export membrane protein